MPTGTGDAAPPAIQPVLFTLQHVYFSDKYLTDDEEEALPEPGPFNTHLEVSRAGALQVGVALTLAAGESLPYDLVVTYAGHFQMSESVPEERREEEWRAFALKAAPLLIYPYVREIVSNLTGRWYEPPLELPYVADLDFTDEGIELPPATPESEHPGIAGPAGGPGTQREG